MKPESKRTVTIEDLVRLKRAERPAAEFWPEFDRQLRAKQLAALVGKPDWWRMVPVWFVGVARYAWPVGAATILAVSFVSMREFSSHEQAMPLDEALATSLDVSPMVSAVAAGLPSGFFSAGSGERKSGEREGAEMSAVVMAEALSLEPAMASLSGGSSSPVSDKASLASSAERSPVLGRLDGSLIKPPSVVEARNSGRLLATATGFEARAMPARPRVDPLQQMVSPSDRSRAKLLTAMVSMSPSEVSVRSAERVNHRISEDRLYDQIHRFGARGAGLNMKF